MTLPPAESPLRLRGREISRNQVPRPRNQSVPVLITQQRPQSAGSPNSQLSELTGMSWSASITVTMLSHNKQNFLPMVFFCPESTLPKANSFEEESEVFNQFINIPRLAGDVGQGCFHPPDVEGNSTKLIFLCQY